MLTRLECVSRKGDNESYNLQDSVTLLGTLKLDLECLETQIKLPCWQALSMGLHVGQSGKYPKKSMATLPWRGPAKSQTTVFVWRRSIGDRFFFSQLFMVCSRLWVWVPGYLKEDLTISCSWRPSCLNLNLPSFFSDKHMPQFFFINCLQYDACLKKNHTFPAFQSMGGSNLQWKVVSFTSKYGKRRGKGARVTAGPVEKSECRFR